MGVQLNRGMGIEIKWGTKAETGEENQSLGFVPAACRRVDRAGHQGRHRLDGQQDANW